MVPLSYSGKPHRPMSVVFFLEKYCTLRPRKYLFELAGLMCCISSLLIYNYLYEKEFPEANSNFEQLHQFIFSIFIIIFELFFTGIPVRIYHVVYTYPVAFIYCMIQFGTNLGTREMFPIFDPDEINLQEGLKILNSLAMGHCHWAFRVRMIFESSLI